MPVSGFVSRAACRGHRPSQLASLTVRSRPDLVGKLLKNRDVARFIVAPSGYGKTALASEYAETVRSWANTFWINARSPCFVRDLDAGAIASDCRSFDPDVSLVVFDDVPELEPDRQESLSSEINALLARGCEVLLTCVPSCDSVGSLQRDRLRLGARDLLLSDGELDAARTADERARRPADQVGPAQRVPVLAWETEQSRFTRFVDGALGENLPSGLLLVIATALVLQKGAVADFAGFGRLDMQVLAEIAGDYPHLGFDGDLECFEAPRIDVEALGAPLRKQLADLVAPSRFGTSVGLVHAWASALLDDDQASRACALVREVCPRRSRARWAVENAPALVRRACFFPLFRLVTDRKGADAGVRSSLDALEALCRRVLGDEEGALRCAKRNAFNDAAPGSVRVIGQLVIAMLGGKSAADRACGELRAQADRALERPLDERSTWDLVAQAWCASTRGVDAMCRCWAELADAGASRDVLCLATSWLFNLFEGADGGLAAEAAATRHRAERFARDELLENVESGAPDYLVASAGLSMEGAHMRGMEYADGPLEAGSLILLRRVEMDVLAQRRLFDEDRELAEARRQDWSSTHPAALYGREVGPAQARPERSVPLLSLKLFGCFEVSIGGVPVEYAKFKRQNTRALLVLLAVNQGRELSREAVAEAMWPQSPEQIAHKNFYSVWSHLRRVLSLPDGTCPYLIRHQYGCSLDARYVQSDAARLNDICRELLFSTPNIERWSTLFSEIDKDFSSDLMPSERKNALVVQARNEYRTRLIDALVAATMSIIDSENAQWGVWLARAAVGRDETREDAYVALMRAQIAVNQRTAAMMTYLQCRRVLADQLGIDPAPETTALYESLLDSR